MKRFIGDKAFYKMVLLVAVPIMLQNFITNFVSMLDNIMVGTVGTEQMSGVAIVNQLVFVFNLTIFGALSGAGIFTAQFHGKNDLEGVCHTVRFKVIASAAITALAFFVLLAFGDGLINMYLHDGSYDCDLAVTFECAKEYLTIILFGLPFFAATQIFASTLRETGETMVPMLMGLVAVVTNCVFNYLLIFGKLGFPVMGAAGAAIATDISRVVECALLLLFSIRHRDRYPFVSRSFTSLKIPRALTVSMVKKGMPLLVNECLWSIGVSLLAVTYSYHGLAVVAGTSIASTVSNLFNITFMAFGTSIGIVVGKLLGAGRFDEAVDTNRKMMVFSVAVSIAVGLLMIAFGGVIPNLYRTSAESKAYAAYFIRVSACAMPLYAFAHASYFCLRSGGKTVITFLFDSVFECLIVVPVAFLLYNVGHLSIWVIYPLIASLSLVKDVVGYVLVKKRVWVNNIVSEY